MSSTILAAPWLVIPNLDASWLVVSACRSSARSTPGVEHSMDREEVFVAVAGRALATVGGDEAPLAAGDALVVPAGRRFSLANPSAEPFRAVVALPVGGRASMPGQAPFVPPWAE
jgi:mannose-6-phosphate isomerase-like protein (cupin superfamily)